MTGQIGEVMKESAQAAFSLLKHDAKLLGIDPDVFGKTDVHVHVEGGGRYRRMGRRALRGGDVYGAGEFVFGEGCEAGCGDDGGDYVAGLVLPIGGVKGDKKR